MFRRLLAFVLVVPGLSGCAPSYSPDTYASNAAQQANKVEQGIIVGVRTVGVSAAGTVGTVTGAAAGGIAGSQTATGPISAFAALGGSLVGGIAGSAVEHATADTKAFEYIVRKANGDLISVTQADKTPLVLGQKVLVIAGNQARVVLDYTQPPPSRTADAAKVAPPANTADSAPREVKAVESKPPESPTDDGKPVNVTTTPASPVQPSDAKTNAASAAADNSLTPAPKPAVGAPPSS